jgi:hypothetical protein
MERGDEGAFGVGCSQAAWQAISFNKIFGGIADFSSGPLHIVVILHP